MATLFGSEKVGFMERGATIIADGSYETFNKLSSWNVSHIVW